MRVDGTYILLIIGAVITLIASAKVKLTFNKYKNKHTANGITGAQAAAMILRLNGINDVCINAIPGNLTDNYNPKTNSLNLSEAVYGRASIGAVAVAAHECGHAIQHHSDYAPIRLRSALVPYANIGSKIGIPIVILSWWLGLEFQMSNGSYFSLATVGIWLFSLAIAFQLVTLPVEFDASARALKILRTENILNSEEMKGARKVLTAAALTYVAAAASSVLQLIRLVLLNDRRGRRS